MGKSEATLELEDAIYSATKNQGTHGCFEVTIGWFGKERVDYLTYDCKGVWRCYEIKASVSDFHSKAAKTFIGHLNYYVFTPEVYEKVKDEIPADIGVFVYKSLVKRPKRRELGVDEKILWQSMIRSLAWQYSLTRKSENLKYMQQLKRERDGARADYKRERRRYCDVRQAVMDKYGHEAWFDLSDD